VIVSVECAEGLEAVARCVAADTFAHADHAIVAFGVAQGGSEDRQG
jgi:hypothetical protein